MPGTMTVKFDGQKSSIIEFDGYIDAMCFGRFLRKLPMEYARYHGTKRRKLAEAMKAAKPKPIPAIVPEKVTETSNEENTRGSDSGTPEGTAKVPVFSSKLKRPSTVASPTPSLGSVPTGISEEGTIVTPGTSKDKP